MQKYLKKLQQLLPHALYNPEGPQAMELSMLTLVRVSFYQAKLQSFLHTMHVDLLPTHKTPV